MRRFFLGFLAGIIAVLLAGFAYVRLGFFDPRADVSVSRFEQRIAMPSLDASIARRAPTSGSAPSGEVDLIAGMKLYQANCAGCHGDINHRHAPLADAFYPRAPQFLDDAPDMPDDENLYIIQHGIRLTGMPAWKELLTDEQMLQITAFLSHMDKLPPSVLERWKVEAAGMRDGK